MPGAKLRRTLLVAGVLACAPLLAGSRCDRKTWGQVVNAVWRYAGNAFVVLNSDVGGSVVHTIDFSNEPYPPATQTDGAFYQEARVRDGHGEANLTTFELMCGAPEENPGLRTTVVFWSEDNWSGQKQQFECGGDPSPTAETTATSGALSLPVRSFCVVTDSSPDKRRSRCLGGPRCDDGMRNGSESDVDCGGACATKCLDGQTCQNGSDCRGGICEGQVCKSPTCSDGQKNQGECDADCGGPCSKCANGRTCTSASCCQSNRCVAGKCDPVRTCSGSVANSTAQNFEVIGVTPFGCGTSVVVFANGLAEAKQCAASAGLTPVTQLCSYTFQIESNPAYYSTQVSNTQANAVNCGRAHTCGNCSWQYVSTGVCVAQP